MHTEPHRDRVELVPTRLGRLHVRIIGTGQTTVLWPSMFVDSHSFDRLVPLLPDGRQYVLVDGPGIGLSDPLLAPTDIAGAAAAAIDLLEQLGESAPVDWIGNAFGGHVGYRLAARSEVLRSLVAVSAPAEPIPAALRRQIALLSPMLRLAGPVGPVRSAIVRALLTDASAGDPQILDVVHDSLRRPSRRSMANALRSFILNRVDVTAELAEIAVPALYVASDDRGDWSPEAAHRSADRTPNARVVTMTGARTLIPLEQPEQLARVVADFWRKLDPATRPVTGGSVT